MGANLHIPGILASPMIAPISWDDIDGDKYLDEKNAVAALIDQLTMGADLRKRVAAQAESLVTQVRLKARNQGLMESFLQEFSLSTAEGLALMSLAEALLRTPDDANQSLLINERIGSADWASHRGQSESLVVNASSWGLMLTKKWGEAFNTSDGTPVLRRLIARLGEPVVRMAVGRSIRLMGEHFVLGCTIEAALARAKAEDLLCSFDMLGEGARTEEDAVRYEESYGNAIAALAYGASAAGEPKNSHGISVKLSALSPRYETNQEGQAWKHLYPRVLKLAQAAALANINFTLDAEESDRLVLSLKLLERLALEPSLGKWSGLGLAVQAYQKRAPQVIERVIALARNADRRLMVRLVKGAYWDTEIKRAQVGGCPDYPVYTTKPATDLSYLVCAQALIKAAPAIYSQFATHNAHTVAAIKSMVVEAGVEVEFQRLHGMGEALYQAASQSFGEIKLRTYAPVGAYEDLLPYLVRRLLENGANNSFVRQLLDENTSPQQIARDPVSELDAAGNGRNSNIPVPAALYGDRANSDGLDVSRAMSRNALEAALDKLRHMPLEGLPIVCGLAKAKTARMPVKSPFDPDMVLGYTAEADRDQIEAAFSAARQAQPDWDRAGGETRATTLREMAGALQKDLPVLASLCVREAGKTWLDAIAEVREAIDFCNYYAMLAERGFSGPLDLKGPVGETNQLEMHGRGIFVCISPWNFPLAIFTGQVAAALAAGNAVLAKPAEQTPLIAAMAVRLFHAAGLDARLLHLLPGRGETVGATLASHSGLDGIAFTGGTDTAKAINRVLAARAGAIVPFIAETGGLNAMFVDTTAQREQVIDDVIISAFGSAGQRCSALRLLFLPEETADSLIEGIAGAMDALIIDDPANFSTDIGPVIDAQAQDVLTRHAAMLRTDAKVIKQSHLTCASKLLFAPVLAEITLDQLPNREVFGPILHVIRYGAQDLDNAARALASKGFGLTLGIHSRIDGFISHVRALVPAGNVYVNRSIIGAVVGVQPFGGEGLSGTGPKAGGPLALTRYAVERAVSVNTAARGGDPVLLNM